jgi:hypothetical protein
MCHGVVSEISAECAGQATAQRGLPESSVPGCALLTYCLPAKRSCGRRSNPI